MVWQMTRCIGRIGGFISVSMLVLTLACNPYGAGSGGSTVVDGVDICPQKGSRALTGAGATFPFPLLSAMFDEYFYLCRVRVNYQSIGSGGGIRAIQDMTVDFGASEAIMSAAQRELARGGEVLHIPFTAGAVAIVYNLSGIRSGELRLTPDVLADIYLKRITHWNDPRIAAINPGLNLPSLEIAVVHRSDGSGTTFVFTNYLSKVSEEWRETIGYATSVSWRGDIGGPGNEGVAQQVRQIPGSIGYVERAYALQTRMTWAQIQNRSGNWVEPTREAAAAAANIPDLPDNMEVLYTDTSVPDGYPIAGFAWLLVYADQRDEAKADAIARLVWWMLGEEGQAIGEALEYVPITGEANAKAKELVKKIRYQGQPVLQLAPAE